MTALQLALHAERRLGFELFYLQYLQIEEIFSVNYQEEVVDTFSLLVQKTETEALFTVLLSCERLLSQRQKLQLLQLFIKIDV